MAFNTLMGGVKVTKKGKVVYTKPIGQWRGSILNWKHGRLIGSLHPVALFKQPRWQARCLLDWKRIGAEYRQPHVLPTRKTQTLTDPDIVAWHVDEALKAQPPALTIDIETVLA